jgi:hypothetical protein
MVAINKPKPPPLGRLLSTPAALQTMDEAQQLPLDLFMRHQRGDWGEVGNDDKQANEQALENGERLLSAYRLKTGVKVWVITEADRSATTILLPDEY